MHDGFSCERLKKRIEEVKKVEKGWIQWEFKDLTEELEKILGEK